MIKSEKNSHTNAKKWQTSEKKKSVKQWQTTEKKWQTSEKKVTN